MTDSISRELARFAATVRTTGLPDPVGDKVATHVLDVVGVQLAASRQPFAPAIRTVALGLGGGTEAVGIGLAEGQAGSPRARPRVWG